MQVVFLSFFLFLIIIFLQVVFLDSAVLGLWWFNLIVSLSGTLIIKLYLLLIILWGSNEKGILIHFTSFQGIYDFFLENR